MMARCDADHVDNITEPGIPAILSEGDDNPVTESVCEKIKLSVDVHGSRTVAVIGHWDCGANPVSDSEQLKQIGKSANRSLLALVSRSYYQIEQIEHKLVLV